MAASSCISFGGSRIDRAVVQEVLDRLQPLGVEAALSAMNAHAEEDLEKRRQLGNALEQARFEAARAHRQYDQVDPDNRLVAGELERRWNERLASVRSLEEQLAQHDIGLTITLSLRIANACSHSAETSHVLGTAPARALKRARKSFAY